MDNLFYISDVGGRYFCPAAKEKESHCCDPFV
jgi:hypothetical protein